MPILASGSTGGHRCSFRRTVRYTVYVGAKPVTGTELLVPAKIIFNIPVYIMYTKISPF